MVVPSGELVFDKMRILSDFAASCPKLEISRILSEKASQSIAVE